MHRIEGLPAALHVEADGVDHAEASGNDRGDGGLVVHVCCHARQPLTLLLLRVPRRHAHRKAEIGQALRHAPAEKRSEEHTSELQSLMRISYAVFCLKKKNTKSNIIESQVTSHPDICYSTM